MQFHEINAFLRPQYTFERAASTWTWTNCTLRTLCTIPSHVHVRLFWCMHVHMCVRV